MSAQVNEELKEVVTPKDKTIGSLNQQTSGFSKLDMQQIIREDHQQFLSNAVPDSKCLQQRRTNLKVRKFHSRFTGCRSLVLVAKNLWLVMNPGSINSFITICDYDEEK